MSSLVWAIPTWSLLGFEVDKHSKISIKISNATEYVELDIQNNEAPKINNSII